jgi:hypothetical protein
MKPGDYAWLALAVGVTVYEIVAAIDGGGELLSEACDRYRAAHPVITYGGIIFVAGHLGRVWPRRVDPLCRLADALAKVAR